MLLIECLSGAIPKNNQRCILMEKQIFSHIITLSDLISAYYHIQGELKMTREEKNMIEKRLQELEQEHMRQQEQLRLEAEQKALVSLRTNLFDMNHSPCHSFY